MQTNLAMIKERVTFSKHIDVGLVYFNLHFLIHLAKPRYFLKMDDL